MKKRRRIPQHPAARRIVLSNGTVLRVDAVADTEYLKRSGNTLIGAAAGGLWTELALQETTWSTAVATTIETGIPTTDGDYFLIITVWLERTVATTWRRLDRWIFQLRRTSGTLAFPWTNAWVSIAAGGGSTPSQTFAISGDDLTHTVTQAGASGRVCYIVQRIYLGDVST